MDREEMSCVCEAAPLLILACSGGSNVGQIANNLMVELDKRGIGRVYCLAGVGGDLMAFVESCKEAEVLLIDGCTIACGKKVLERHNISPKWYLVVTEMGIEKIHSFERVKEQTEEALEKALKAIGRK